MLRRFFIFKFDLNVKHRRYFSNKHDLLKKNILYKKLVFFYRLLYVKVIELYAVHT